MTVFVQAPFDAGVTSGDYRAPLTSGQFANRTPSTSATVCVWPFYSAKARTLATVGIYLVTAQTGGEAMSGIYAHDSATGRTGTLLEDLGTLDLSTGGGSLKEWSVSSAAPSGIFWVAVHLKDIATQVTVRGSGSAHAAGVGGMAINSNGISSNTAPAYFAVAAYPGSMPADLSSIGPSTSVNFPIPIISFA